MPIKNTFIGELLVDDRGYLWLPGSPALRQRLHGSACDADIGAYAVRNLGFARIRRWQRSFLISLFPALVNRKTFDAICLLLADGDYDRVVLDQPGEVAGIELFTSAEDALARICFRANSVRDGAGIPFFSEPISLSRLNHPKRSELKAQLRSWRAARGWKEPGWLPGNGMPARSIVTIHGPGDRAIVEHFGAFHQVFDACWTLLAIGNDLENQPDPLYGRNVADSYHRVSRSGQPMLELVDATISAPGRPPRRSRYERLLLPWRSQGRTLVSAMSVLRSSVVVDELM